MCNSCAGTVSACFENIDFAFRATDVNYGQFQVHKHRYLTAPAFTYFFPLLDQVLRRSSVIANNEATMIEVLEIITAHAEMRITPGSVQEHLVRLVLLGRKIDKGVRTFSNAFTLSLFFLFCDLIRATQHYYHERR